MVNRARGLVVRLFDAICNCANNAAAPAQRIKLRGKRASTSAESGSKSEPKDKAKKQENGKDKKDDKKKEEHLEMAESKTVEQPAIAVVEVQ